MDELIVDPQGSAVSFGANSVLVAGMQPVTYDDQTEKVTIPGLGSFWTGGIMADHPVAYYRLGDAAGTVARDLSGHGLNGTYVNGVTLGAPGVFVNENDTAATLDGINDYITVGSVPELQIVGDLTIEFWYNKAAAEASDWQRLVGKGSSTHRNYGIWEAPGTDGRLLFQQYYNGSSRLDLYSTSSIPVGRWTHIAVTVEGNTARIYIDGRLDAQGTRSGAPSTSTDPLTMGYGHIHTYFPGTLDEVAVFNSALPSERIIAHYNARYAAVPEPPAIVAVRPLPADGGSVTAAIDQLIVETSKGLLHGPANNPANWELRRAGPDAAFDTADDVLQALTVSPEYLTGTTITLDIAGDVLPVGRYRLTAFASSLAGFDGQPLDGNGDGIGGDNFVRVFTVADAPGVKIETADNAVREYATRLDMIEDPSGSGYFVARGLGSIDPAVSGDWWSDPDYWSFSALAGDVVSICVDTPDSDLDPYVELRNAADGALASDDNSGPGNDSYIACYAVPISGQYFVRVGKYYSSSTPGAYQLRVEVARSVQLESDAGYSNDSPAGANALNLDPGDPGHATGKMTGTVMAAEGANTDEDYFSLGMLDMGVVVTMNAWLPSDGTLHPRLQLVDAEGTAVPDADGNAADGHFSATVGDAKSYYAIVDADSGAGTLGQYVLQVDLADAAPPTIVQIDGLPAAGATSDRVISSFSITFSEQMAPQMVNDPTAFDLREDGADGVFDTADDTVITLILPTAYTRHARTVSFWLQAGPLASGNYRFTATNILADRAGNPIDGNDNGTGGDAYVLAFTLDLPAEFTLEGPDNDTPADATILPLVEDPVGSGYFMGLGLGSIDPAVPDGNWWTESDYWRFEAVAGDRVAVSVDTPDSALDPYVELRNAADGGLVGSNNEGPDADAYISHYVIASSGTYYVRVGHYYWSGTPGDYQLRLDVARGMQLESDANYSNDSTAGANGLTLAGTGGGTSLWFDGQDDYVYVGDKPSLDLSGPLTFEAWVYPSDAGSDEPIIAKEGPGGKQSYWFGVYGGQFGLLLNDGRNGWALDARHSGTISNNQWYHLASTWDGTTWRNYLNGALVGEGTWAGPLVDSSSPLTIGSNSEFNNTRFRGIIEELRIWNIARSQSDLQATLSRQLEGTESGLAGYWRFNDTPGQAAADGSPSANHGQLGTTSSSDAADPTWLSYGAPLLGDSTQRHGTIAGTVMAGESGNVDEDYFNLGTVQAGETILARVILPQSSTLQPVIEIRNASNQVVSVNPNPADATIARVDITTNGTYYVLVLGLSGQGPFGQYLLNATIAPTGEFQFADLSVTRIVAPVTASSGETVHLEWTVGNYGTAPTDVSDWQDRIVLSINEIYGDNDDIHLAPSEAHHGGLDAGGSYTATADRRLPLDITGDYWLLVEADGADQVFELNLEDNNARRSDVQITIVLTPYADLAAGAVAASVWRAIAGDPIEIDWRVDNVGVGTTGNGTPGGTVTSWIDRIVLSLDGAFGTADDILLANVTHTGSLDAGAGYDGHWSGSLPTGISGSFHVMVMTDFGSGFGAVYEYTDAASNIAQAAATVDVAAAPFGDLVAVIDSAPAGAQIAQAITLTWTVTNTTDAWSATPATGWYDRIVLSRDSLYGNADDRFLANLWHAGALGVGASYSATTSVNLPADFSGQGYLMVVADGQGQVYEFLYETNNASAGAGINVLAPDLVGSISLNTFAGVFGDTIPVDWAVANQGTGPVPAAVRDRIWLSSDAVLGSDTLLATVDAGTIPLLPSGQYSRDNYLVAVPLIPSLAEGDYYLILQTDALGQQPEANETNNTAVSAGKIHLVFPPLPDLQVADITVVEDLAGTLVSGGSMTIRWHTANRGTNVVAGSFQENLVVRNLTRSQTLLNIQVPYDVGTGGVIAAGEVRERESVFTLPNGLTGAGTLQITITTDVQNNITESYSANTPETNNVATASVVASLRPYPDLVVASVTAVPDSVQSGTSTTIHWRIENSGNGVVSTSFSERVRVVNTTTGALLLERTVAYDPAAVGSIDAGQGRDRSLMVTIPDGSGSVGDILITVATDSGNAVFEYNADGIAETNNSGTAALTVILAPYPDLAATYLNGPTQTIADPARVTIDWTVANQGSASASGAWWDVIVASTDGTFGDGDDRELGRFEWSSGLDGGSSYTRSEELLLPPAFSGRFTLFVKTDRENAVFEDNREANNVGVLGQPFDVMPIPYADLVVASVHVPAPGFSGQALEVEWRIENRGIGLTNTGNWTDQIWLATDPAGQNRIRLLGSFYHLGQLAVGDGYDRVGTVPLPDGIAGDYYLVVRTGGPFEFIHTDNNGRVSDQFSVSLTPPPDLVVTGITAPTEPVEEGTRVDVAWTVRNIGGGVAGGYWEDTVYLRKVGDSSAATLSLGTFRYDGPLAAGQTYTRSEQFTLPVKTHGLYEAVVTTNYNRRLYEHDLYGNNTTVDDTNMQITVRPRPDLMVLDVGAPDEVDPGQTVAVQFVVINQGNTATTTPNWVDKIYLSLDGFVTSDDIVIGQLTNQSALEAGASYLSLTDSAVIPRRFRGDMYILVSTDAGGSVEEWPNEGNNTKAVRIYVTPQPLPDLVTAEVVCPAQAIEGATIEVRYTVTNLGPGETPVDDWTDTIWLTRDKNRPHPGQGDVLLQSLPHHGSLVNRAGYDVTTTVKLPTGLTSGVYYIMPWTDPYAVVLEDTLAINVNPDDPHEIDNNNYKARAIDIIALIVPQPDLVLENVQATAEALGGEQFTVTWIVSNQGKGSAGGSWDDEVWLTDSPGVDPGRGNSLLLGTVTHENGLASKDNYTASLTVTLNPAAVGSHVIVKVDVQGNGRVGETDETNNRGTAPTLVTPVPADLVVTDVRVLGENRSGEPTTIQYTVRNDGPNPVWIGTKYWIDYLWIGADATFIRDRASWFGKSVHSHSEPLQPGESYTAQVQGVLPKGIGGEFFVYIHPDAHDDNYDERLRVVQTGWWPAEHGENSGWLDHFSRWAYENTANNVYRAEIQIAYYEPDLVLAVMNAPALGISGQSIPVTITVRNEGTRQTRAATWPDRLFLSRDPSLDRSDLYLGEVPHRSLLPKDGEYTATFDVRLPDGIEGTFYLLALVDSPAGPGSGESDIGFGLPGVGFSENAGLPEWDNVWRTQRSLARGAVAEYQLEGNNSAGAVIAITRADPPDLQVTQVLAPERVRIGQDFSVQYTVTNRGGNTMPSQSKWDDLIYLSRDEFLDIRADRFMGSPSHETPLAAGAGYTQTFALRAPTDITGPYYVFVATDPVRVTFYGRVFELDFETNNDRAADVPMIIELPPPADLVVTDITIPAQGKSGDPITLHWTVQNNSDEPAVGSRWDTAYLSTDATWDIHDVPLGRASFSGTLAPDGTYELTLATLLPPATPGQYRVIVRTDIFNQVYEAEYDANNKTASAETLSVTVEQMHLGVPLPITLSTGQKRLFQVTVPYDQTLQVSLRTDAASSQNEIFVRYGAAPTVAVYDAAYEGGLAAELRAVIPLTEPGVYYILTRGFSEPADNTPVTLLAKLLPLAISSVNTDVGGDSKYVTTTIRGARFHPNAIIKLVRPGFAEYEPAVYEVIDGTKIIATFDLTGAPHGLYDLKVINPSGDTAVIPYRFLVERAIEPDVTIGIGGPRIILAGDTGTYSVALQSLSNLDTPYVFFQVGAPEMGYNAMIFGLPYIQFFSGVNGALEGREDIPWAEIASSINTDGQWRAPGYLFDQDANGFTGFSFNIATYPGLKEMHDRAWEQLVNQIYGAFPELAEQGILDNGPAGLDQIQPGLTELYNTIAAIPNDCQMVFVPFRFDVFAAATAMTREEFVAHASQEAETLRQAIIADPEANAALLTLAADPGTWRDLYLASLEEAGLLRPVDDLPPIREHELIMSLMAMLSTGILLGPAGEEILSSGKLTELFDKIRAWYGHDPSLLAVMEKYDYRECPIGGESYDIPIPALPDFADYDLGLSHQTHFEAFRIYVPWLPWEERGAGIPPAFQINGPEPVDGSEFQPLDLSQYLEGEGVAGLASITGPQTMDTAGWLPLGQRLPYTINFANSPDATTFVSEVRIVTQLDEDLDPWSFRLGDVKIGKINVHVPEGRQLFQGEFDFSETEGYILRISAGIDLSTAEATWLIQAIDPLTGELLQDSTKGILGPNNAQNEGAGFVSYTILPEEGTATGAQIRASARVLFNNMPPEDTSELSQPVDGVAPVTELTITRISEKAENFLVEWNANDDEGGSGFKYVTIYVAVDGGDFRIWQRQVTEAQGSAVYEGVAGHTYEFLALAVDVAGNREAVPVGLTAEDDGSGVNLGAAASVPDTTPPNFGIAPEPSPEPTTNPLFEEAEEQIPAPTPAFHQAEYDQVLSPFVGRAFAWGFEPSHADIGPMAIAEAPDGTILISGGPWRNYIYKLEPEGGEILNPWAQMPYPIFNMAFDGAGRLWATTGGGPLIQIDPDSGAVLHEYGDGITMALAVEPGTGLLYAAAGAVWSGGVAGVGGGVEVFDPQTGTFTHFSRDLNLRVASLAFAPDGTLWATTWPDRKQVVRFNERRRGELVLEFEADVDSLAFGQAGTDLEGLLFVSQNTGANNHAGSELTMVDVATLRRVAVADGGTRGDVIITTRDGRVLVSQSHQVDLLNPITAPLVVATYPPKYSMVSLPLSYVTVTFDQDMFVGDGTESASVTNLANYELLRIGADEVPFDSISYEDDTYTVLLTFGRIDPGEYQLRVSREVVGATGLPMQADYATTFTAVSDFTAYTNLEFTNARSDRGAGTVSWDVVITNTSDYDLLLPLILVLDPAQGYEGIPLDAQGRGPDGRWYIDFSTELPDGRRLRSGESSVGRTISIYNGDDRRIEYDGGVSALPTDNERPVFDSEPPVTASVGQPYAYGADAHDPDGVKILYFLYAGPAGMAVDTLTGDVTWLPGAAAQAQTPVVLHAYDTRGGLAVQSFTIAVEGGNHAPVLAELPERVTGAEGQPLEMILPVVDPDGDTLAAWVDALPPGAVFDSMTLRFSWTPDFESAGTFEDVTFHFSDGVNEVSAAITFAIAPGDRGPVLTVPAARTLREGDRLRFYLQGSDPDGEPVTFSSPLLPSINVSNAALQRIDIAERLPYLLPGERYRLAVVGDFEDQQNVPLLGSYLTYHSSDETILLISGSGTIRALADGSAMVLATRGNLAAATAVAVGAAETSEELLLRFGGLNVYPASLTLPETTGQRQFLVKTPQDVDVTVGASGTYYIVGDASIVSAAADGLIAAVGLGSTTVTIVHGPAEVVVPVRVIVPDTGPAAVGNTGGVVQAPGGGPTIQIAPGALTQPVTVTLESVPLPPAAELPLADVFDVGKAFELDLQGVKLDVPAQLSLRLDDVGFQPGDVVYFFKELALTDAGGTTHNTWLLIETGVVGADGVARTSSPPYPGFSAGGQYLAAKADQPDRLVQIGFNAPPGVGVNIGWDMVANIATTIGAGLLPIMPTLSLGLTVLSYTIRPNTVPIATQSVTLHNPTPGEVYEAEIMFPFINPGDLRPIIDQVQLTSLNPAVVEIEGDRFEDADVIFKMGGNEYVGSGTITMTRATITVPDHVILGLAEIVVRHPDTGESNAATLLPSANLGAVGRTGSGIAVFDADTTDNRILAQFDFWGGTDTVFTPDQTRLYAIGDGSVMVVDTIRLQLIDIDPSTPEIDGIPLSGHPFIHQLTTDPEGHFLFVAGAAPTVWVVDIRPNSSTFHQAIRTIALPRARHTITGVAVNADGTRLLVGTGTRPANDGHLTIFALDPDNEPTAAHPSPAGWGALLSDTPLISVPESIVATSNPQYATMTYYYRVSMFTPWGGSPSQSGPGLLRFSTIRLGSGAPQLREVMTEVEGGNLSPLYNPYYSGYYTSILTPRDVVVASDLRYAFVADWELAMVFGYPGQRGDKVGVVRDPFGLSGTPTYLGSTTPIDMGMVTSVVLSGDGSRLFASYAGMHEILVIDTAALTATAEALIADPRTAERRPIDIQNAGVHITPITVFGLLQGMSTQAASRVVLTEPLGRVSAADALQPNLTFRWTVDRASIGSAPVTSTLYVSVMSEGKGLFPDDLTLAGETDCSPYRILTFELPADTFQYALPANIKLTAGQTYYWGVIATAAGWTGRAAGEFQVDPVVPSTPYPSVTVITHGFQLDPLSSDSRFTPAKFVELAHMIADSAGGHVLTYDRRTGNWIDDRSLTDGARAVEDGKPVVLVTEWYHESDISDSGFSEAAADTFFASLAKLNTDVSGKLFNSPMHFIGHSRGTVVNGEIIQRLGTYFPAKHDIHMTTLDPHDFNQASLDVPGAWLAGLLGGVLGGVAGGPVTALGTGLGAAAVAALLGYSTIHYADFLDPNVMRWENIAFYDNYYQVLANPTGLTFTPNGRWVAGADINRRLDGRAGFLADDRIGGTHGRVTTWYAGTIDLSETEIGGERVYRILADKNMSSHVCSCRT